MYRYRALQPQTFTGEAVTSTLSPMTTMSTPCDDVHIPELARSDVESDNITFHQSTDNNVYHEIMYTMTSQRLYIYIYMYVVYRIWLV